MAVRGKRIKIYLHILCGRSKLFFGGTKRATIVCLEFFLQFVGSACLAVRGES